MLELLAAALRRDTEERKSWHSLPHGSRSRACDLRKRRARGDGCGRGGVSRAPCAWPVPREHSWSRAGAFQRDASHPRISAMQWRWVGRGRRTSACAQKGGLSAREPGWGTSRDHAVGQQPPTQTQDSAVPGVIRPCQCVTEPVQPRHGHRGVRTGFEMPRLGGETHPSVPSCAPHPRGFTVAVCLVARPLSARGHVPAASTWRWPEP